MYELTQDGAAVRRLSDGAFVPADARNADWREYLRYVAAGGRPDPAPPPPAPPRDLAAELDALKADVARAGAAEAVLIEKGVVAKGEIDAKVPKTAEAIAEAAEAAAP